MEDNMMFFCHNTCTHNHEGTLIYPGETMSSLLPLPGLLDKCLPSNKKSSQLLLSAVSQTTTQLPPSPLQPCWRSPTGRHCTVRGRSGSKDKTVHHNGLSSSSVAPPSSTSTSCSFTYQPPHYTPFEPPLGQPSYQYTETTHPAQPR